MFKTFSVETEKPVKAWRIGKFFKHKERSVSIKFQHENDIDLFYKNKTLLKKYRNDKEDLSSLNNYNIIHNNIRNIIKNF